MITDNMMQKLTLIAYLYLITSQLKKHSIKNDQKFSLCILTVNSYCPPNFKISQLSFAPTFPSSGTT